MSQINIRSILCILGSGKVTASRTVEVSMEVAKKYGACIQFLHIAPDPDAYMGYFGEGFIADNSLSKTMEEENRKRLEKVKKDIYTLAAAHDIPLDSSKKPAHHASAEFRYVVGGRDEIVTEEGRLSDLIIVDQKDSLGDGTIIPVLFNTGRPVLFIPSIKDGGTSFNWRDKIVAIAWNGSIEAARALHNALPLIEKAEKFYVIVAREHKKSFNLEEQDRIIKYLTAHGFNAEAIVIDRADSSASKTIIDRVSELNVDLLIMGAYGKSMFREIVLGGVTEDMLEQTPIPLLMSH